MSRTVRRQRVTDAERLMIGEWLTKEGSFRSPADAMREFDISNGLMYEIMAELEICEIAKAKVNGHWLRQYGRKPATRILAEQAARDLSWLLAAHYADPDVQAGAHLARLVIKPDDAPKVSRLLVEGAIPQALGTVYEDLRSGVLWIEPARGYTPEDVVEAIRALARRPLK